MEFGAVDHDLASHEVLVFDVCHAPPETALALKSKSSAAIDRRFVSNTTHAGHTDSPAIVVRVRSVVTAVNPSASASASAAAALFERITSPRSSFIARRVKHKS